MATPKGHQVSIEQFLERAHDKNIAAQWDDSHWYTPTARHRRRLLLQIVANLGFRDVLDAGCAQPHLLQQIVHRYDPTSCTNERSYSTIQKLVTHVLFVLFFLNDRFSAGDQLIVLARKNSNGGIPE